MKQKTHSLKKSQIKRDWHLIDLNNQILGRSASTIAQLLQGKQKPYYSPYLDCGDFVVAVNAKSVKVSGKKQKQKIYFRHSGYPGGEKRFSFEEMINKNPIKVIEHAVFGMLPKNKLRRPRMCRLKVFANNKHNYQDKFPKKKD